MRAERHARARIKRHKQVRIKTLGACPLGAIDHFHDVVIGFGHDANLLHGLRLLFGFHDAPELAHGKLPQPQFRFPDAAEFKDQQVASPRFVQVLGQSGPPPKSLWVRSVHLQRLKKRLPSVMHLHEHLISDVGGKGEVGRRCA